MLGQILNAFCLEIQALFIETGATVLKDTQFKPDEMPVHTMPVIVLSLTENPEIKQLIGGLTKADFGWDIKSYFYDQNAGLANDEGFSTEAYNTIDTIYRHITKKQWITEDFSEVCATYGYKLTLNGMSKADPLRFNGGVAPGFQIRFNSVGFDSSTSNRIEDGQLEDVTQSPEGEYLEIYDTEIIVEAEASIKSISINTNTPFVVESNVDWIIVSPINDNIATEIELTIEENTGAARTGILTIKMPTTELENKTITIIQNEG